MSCCINGLCEGVLSWRALSHTCNRLLGWLRLGRRSLCCTVIRDYLLVGEKIGAGFNRRSRQITNRGGSKLGLARRLRCSSWLHGRRLVLSVIALKNWLSLSEDACHVFRFRSHFIDLIYTIRICIPILFRTPSTCLRFLFLQYF